MTTLNEARDAVYERFLTQWGVTTPLTFDNEAFDPPSDGSAWIRISVRNEFGQQASLGPPGQRRFDRFARVFVQIFTKPDTGLKEADTLATLAQGIVEAVSFDGLRFKSGSIREVGVSDGWQSHLVDVPFDYQETK